MPLPPPPINDKPGSFTWLEWYRQLRNYVSTSGSVPWYIINFAGSNITDIAQRNHANLQGLQGGTAGEHFHFTQAQHSNLNSSAPEFDSLVLSNVSGNGIKLDHTTPAFGWKDLLGEVRPKTFGLGAPTLSVFRGGNVRSYSFVAGDDYDGHFHIPHDWAPGTDVHLHVHWAHNGTAISGSLVLNFYFTYAKGHQQATFAAEKNLTQTITTANIASRPQYQHFIDEVQLSTNGGSATQLDSSLLEPDGIILYHMDATTIPTITGGSPNAPFIFTIDLHYQATNITTKNKVPNFYS